MNRHVPSGGREESDVNPITMRPLYSVLEEFPGKWVAVDMKTGEPRAVADDPRQLSAQIRSQGLRNVSVVRAPEPDEPIYQGLG
jgi:hypothetical protein